MPFTGDQEGKLVKTYSDIKYERTLRTKKYPLCQGMQTDCPKEIFPDELKEGCVNCPFAPKSLKEEFRDTLVLIRNGTIEGEIGGDGFAYFIAACTECGQKIHLHGPNPHHPKKLRNLCEHIKPGGFEVERLEGGRLVIKPREVSEISAGGGTGVRGTRTKKAFEVSSPNEINLEELYEDPEIKSIWIKRKPDGKYRVACLNVY